MEDDKPEVRKLVNTAQSPRTLGIPSKFSDEFETGDSVKMTRVGVSKLFLEKV